MLLQKLKHSSLIYLERYVDQKHYSPFSEYSEVSCQFQPERGKESFDLPILQLAKEDVHVELAAPHADLLDFYINAETVRFPVHPDLYYSLRHRSPFLSHYRRLYEPELLTVKPTASTRTLLADYPYPHYIKVHLPMRISRFNRRLRDVGIRNSMAISRDLLEMDFPFFFGILPERIGMWHRQSKWGFIIRDAKPWPHFRGNSIMIPYFSLYSNDIHNSQHEPLLIQLIRYTHADPEEYLVEKILRPLIESWCFVALNRGILLWPHGQNILLELNRHLEPIRVIHRDFVGLDVDLDIRNKLELDNSGFTKYVFSNRSLKVCQSKFGHIYDFQIAHHLFEFLLKAVRQYFPICEKKVRNKTGAILRAAFGEDYNMFFPKTVYQYANQPFQDNNSWLVNTHQMPRWR